MLGATWGDETFEIPYGEINWPASAESSEWEPDWVSTEPTPSREMKEPESLKPESCPSGVASGPSCVERGVPPRMAAPKLGLHETMELLSRVLVAGDEDPDLTALSAALKTKLGFSDLKKPPPTVSLGVEVLTRDAKSCRGIHSFPMDTCPSPFRPPVRTVPVCNVCDTTEAEMKSYGLAALAPLATTHSSAPSGGTGDPGVLGMGTKAIATANVKIELAELDPRNVPQWAEEFSELLLLTGQQDAEFRTNCTFIKKLCKKEFFQRQVTTAIRKSSNWGDFLKRLEQMSTVYETDLTVCTEIEELLPLLEFHAAARISEFVAQPEELIRLMNLTSYVPIEPHLWRVGKIPPKTPMRPTGGGIFFERTSVFERRFESSNEDSNSKIVFALIAIQLNPIESKLLASIAAKAQQQQRVHQIDRRLPQICARKTQICARKTQICARKKGFFCFFN